MAEAETPELRYNTWYVVVCNETTCGPARARDNVAYTPE